MFKKNYYVLIILSILLLFCGCSKNDTKSDKQSTIKYTSKNQKAENSKTFQFFKQNFDSNEYTMTLTNENEDGDEVITIGISTDGIVYEDEVTPSSHETTITTKDTITTIYYNTESYRIEKNETELQLSLFNSKDFEGKTYNAGNENIKGKEYYFEEFSDEYGVQRYCFEGNNLKYIVKVSEEKNIYIKVSDIINSFDKNLINIPNGYELYDY
ncbi:MAG: hypothetical protein E7391_01865 [Ruminococcaceae bacterium]|nr:hypothetical protein [Oscillospiraceae bacterium]